MNKKILLVVSIVLTLICVVAVFMYKTTQKHTEGIHIHAGFLVYMDGIKQDYSSLRYMNLTPCGEHDEKKSPEEEQIEKAHLHDGDGDVVHVHRTGAVWNDVFVNSNIEIPDKQVAGYKDGNLIPDILNKPIQAYESIIFVIGDQSAFATLSGQMISQERIRQVEAKSETCGKN